MTRCTPSSSSLTSRATRSCEVAAAPRRATLLRNASVAFAPESAARGDVSVVVTIVLLSSRGSWAVAEERHVVVADEVGDGPAVEVVLRQALLGQPLHRRR